MQFSKKRSSTLTVETFIRLPVELWRKLKRLADEEHLTVKEYIEREITRVIRRRDS